MEFPKEKTPRQYEELGRLTQSLLHTVNNSLASIVGFSEFLTHDLDRHSQNWNFAENIRKSADHLRETIKRLRLLNGLSELASGEMEEPVDLVETVDALLLKLSESLSLKYGITLDFDPDEGLEAVTITAHQGYLFMAFNEVISNAIESFADLPDKADRQITILLEKNPDDANEVILSVTDNGIGMVPEILDQCRVPFYTAKDPSVHHGLGLSIVNTILTKIGARFDIESDSHQGTKVAMVFPRAAQNEAT